jgi:hypothetical protein
VGRAGGGRVTRRYISFEKVTKLFAFIIYLYICVVMQLIARISDAKGRETEIPYEGWKVIASLSGKNDTENVRLISLKDASGELYDPKTLAKLSVKTAETDKPAPAKKDK